MLKSVGLTKWANPTNWANATKWANLAIPQTGLNSEPISLNWANLINSMQLDSGVTIGCILTTDRQSVIYYSTNHALEHILFHSNTK